MNADTAPSLKQAALADLEHEFATTRRVLERVPDEHFAWKPHERSMALGGLATHLATLPFWAITTLESDELDMAKGMPENPLAKSRDEVLRRFDETAERVRAALAAADDAALARTWTMRNGEHVIVQQPRVAVLRTFVANHMIHHRGQMSVYLRLLDVPVPSIYGPSADER
jgi:uncharacterized damage-inducible protein DinB